jgi:hypothetical protein
MITKWCDPLVSCVGVDRDLAAERPWLADLHLSAVGWDGVEARVDGDEGVRDRRRRAGACQRLDLRVPGAAHRGGR